MGVNLFRIHVSEAAAGVVKVCSYKFRNIHKKTLVLESLFNKVAGLQLCNFIKKAPTQVFFSEYCKIL